MEQCGPVSSPRFFIAVATAFALLFTEHRYVQFDFTALLYAPSYLLSWDGRQTAQHTSLDGHTNKVPAYWGHFSVFSMYIIYFSKSSSWLLKPNKRKTQTCFSIQPKILILIQNQWKYHPDPVSDLVINTEEKTITVWRLLSKIPVMYSVASTTGKERRGFHIGSD